LALKQISNP
jgi:hypothetical protein